jgi:hypothetical protein
MRFLQDHMPKTVAASEVEPNGAADAQGRPAFDYEAFLDSFLE